MWEGSDGYIIYVATFDVKLTHLGLQAGNTSEASDGYISDGYRINPANQPGLLG